MISVDFLCSAVVLEVVVGAIPILRVANLCTHTNIANSADSLFLQSAIPLSCPDAMLRNRANLSQVPPIRALRTITAMADHRRRREPPNRTMRVKRSISRRLRRPPPMLRPLSRTTRDPRPRSAQSMQWLTFCLSLLFGLISPMFCSRLSVHVIG